MRKIYIQLLSALLFFSITSQAQVTLSGTSYLETFDNLASGLPTGWSIRTGANASTLGTAVTTAPASSAWNGTTGAFKNFASADGLTSASTATEQGASTDRALGVRQTGTFGDPGAAFVVQLANTTGVSGFSLTFKLQSLDVASTRSVNFAVDYGFGATPTSFTATTTSPVTLTTGNSTFANTTVTVNFGSALDNRAENVWIRVVALAGSTGSGSRPSTAIDDFQLNYGAGGTDATAPTVLSLLPANNSTNVPNTLSTASITFNESVQKGTGSIILKKVSDGTVVQTIDVTSAGVTASGNTVSFPVTLSPNTAYYIEVADGAIKDIAGNNFAGIIGSTTWTFATGNLLYSANFNVCSSTPTEGFTAYSVTGAEVWGCTTFGRDAANSPSGSAANGVQINGFSGGTNVPNEDWLISPAFNLTATTYPLLTFWSRTAFNGAPLQLKVSTNYSGSGDPRLATWTDIDGRFPKQASDLWTVSSQINLSAFKQAAVYVAFVYNSTSEEGARWTLDDISLDNSATPPAASLTTSASDLQYGFAAAGTNSSKTFTVTGSDITSDITVTATAGFLVSADGVNFSSSATFAQASANNTPQTVYVRFSPSQDGQNYSGTVTVATSGLTSTVGVSGTSIDPAKTLEVVNWNIEWFGSTSFGPTNEDQQQQNIKTILQNISADLFALVEIVDTAKLGTIVRSLPGGYSFVVSNYGSHTNPTVSGDGPLSEAQKLGFVYKTSMFSNITTTPLLNLTTNTAEDAASTNYNNWSSGRYPFMMTADVTLGGVTKTIRFIAIHAKANTSPTATAYARRKAGADSLYAFLQRNYPTDNIVILGDFNDDLDQTITAGINPPVTSYSTFVNDSLNFPALTLPLSRAGKKSTVSYNDMIDQVVVSNEMRPFYMNNSANVLTDVTSLVSSYGSTTTDHYPVFTRYAFDAAILPVKLLDFKATKLSSSVVLDWKTATEINNKQFVIERSTDAIHFEPIGSVNGAGNSSTENSYSFTDKKPVVGNNFYRIKQVDKDGKTDVSKVLKVNFSSSMSARLTPNPASNTVHVSLNNFNEAVTLQLIDLHGQVIKQQYINNGVAQVDLKITDVSKGTYVLKVIGNTNTISEKLIIQ